jgi:hypothetical protein
VTTSPLESVGRWHAAEVTMEVAVPLALSSGSWWLASRVLGPPVAGAPFTPMEVNALLGACVALTGWAAGRQLFLYGRRAPRTAFVWGAAVAAFGLFVLPLIVGSKFEDACVARGGEVVVSAPLDASGDTPTVCRVGWVAANTYLPGILLRPAWEGTLSPPQWVGFLFLAGISSIGLREQRIRRTRVPVLVAQGLRLAPAAGSASVIGSPAPKKGRVQACANATLWGEVCGQLYAAEKEFSSGEWCLRCNQVFRPVDREVTFKVVSLFSADVDVLNGLERLDAAGSTWPQGTPRYADARLSAQERWVVLGTISMPDVVTVAQLLAFVHEQLAGWGGSTNPDVKEAVALAVTRASRIHAWIWQGAVAQRLTYARPTPSARLAVGSIRLRDLDLDSGQELTLQLDIGLLPLELRVAYRKTFLNDAQPPIAENSIQNLWIPVGPPGLPEDAAGLWVPRIEGEALRVWLSTERTRGEDVRGVASPLPYRRMGAPDIGAPARGPLDFVRLEIDPELGEPKTTEPVGGSIAEWRWFEPEQIELLRSDTLVLVEARRHP